MSSACLRILACEEPFPQLLNFLNVLYVDVDVVVLFGGLDYCVVGGHRHMMNCLVVFSNPLALRHGTELASTFIEMRLCKILSQGLSPLKTRAFETFLRHHPNLVLRHRVILYVFVGCVSMTALPLVLRLKMLGVRVLYFTGAHKLVLVGGERSRAKSSICHGGPLVASCLDVVRREVLVSRMKEVRVLLFLQS